MLDQPGLTETSYRRLDEAEEAEHHALVRVVRLSGGFRLLVERDLEEGRGSATSSLPPRW